MHALTTRSSKRENTRARAGLASCKAERARTCARVPPRAQAEQSRAEQSKASRAEQSKQSKASRASPTSSRLQTAPFATRNRLRRLARYHHSWWRDGATSRLRFLAFLCAHCLWLAGRHTMIKCRVDVAWSTRRNDWYTAGTHLRAADQTVRQTPAFAATTSAALTCVRSLAS